VLFPDQKMVAVAEELGALLTPHNSNGVDGEKKRRK